MKKESITGVAIQRYPKSDLKKEEELQQKLVELLADYKGVSMCVFNYCIVSPSNEALLHFSDKDYSSHFIVLGTTVVSKKNLPKILKKGKTK